MSRELALRVNVIIIAVILLLVLTCPAYAGSVSVASSQSNLFTKFFSNYRCDGTNDRMVIQLALFMVGPGDTVELSEGTFFTDGSIVIPSGRTLAGKGPDRTILSMKGYGDIFFALQKRSIRQNAFLDVSNDNSVLKDFTVTQHGWIHITASNVLLQNIVVRDSFTTPQGKDWKINAFAAFGVNLQNQDLHDITFINCKALRVGTFGFRNDNMDDSPALGGHPTHTLSNIMYINCEANTCGSGVYTDPTDLARGWEIYASGWDVQEFIKVDGVLMQDCRAINNWMNGIHFEGRDGYNILVENCRATDNGQRKIAKWGKDSGIGIRGGRNAIIRNCYTENNGNYGYAHIGIWNTRLENCIDNGSGIGFFCDSSLIPRTYTNNVYLKCTSMNAGTFGFLFDDTYNCHLYDCTVVNAAGNGRYLNYRTGGVMFCTFEITAQGGASPGIINGGGIGNVYDMVRV